VALPARREAHGEHFHSIVGVRRNGQPAAVNPAPIISMHIFTVAPSALPGFISTNILGNATHTTF
jgi:hypothetical protein